jgi:hypothetical protein
MDRAGKKERFYGGLETESEDAKTLSTSFRIVSALRTWKLG